MFEDWDTFQEQTKDLLLLESPVKITILCTSYLIFVFYAGPKFMKNRPAYTLKNVLIGYNVFQIVVSFYLTREFLRNGVSFRDFYQCKLPDYSDSPQNKYFINLLYYLLLVKIVELIETIFFVLRKKQNQISTLHVYHHISTIYIAYFAAKFVGCGLGCIGGVLNLAVHFFMYSYYLLSTFGGENWKRSLAFFKRVITKIQIIQFVILITNAFVVLPCIDPIVMVGFTFTFPDVLVLLYMFVKFYIKSYSIKSVGPIAANNTIKKIN